ncbi:MAG: hypothetical protein CMH52_09680 [Myxococcales bacterium]|nr:hypothetical protein [Myxococcales bacterium]
MAFDHRNQRFTPAELNHLGLVGLGLIHELGNPLSAMHLSLDLLIEQLESGDELDGETLLSRLNKERIRLHQTTQLLHRFRRLLAHKPPVLAPIKLNDVVAGLLDELRVTLRQFGVIEIHNKIPGPIHFKTDGVWLKQILSCLLINSAQATRTDGEGSWVKIDCSQERGWVHIRVSDNGGGLEQPMQLGQTTKADGLGIGLALVDRLVTELSGTLVLENSDSGLVAWVRLPVDPGDDA